MYARTQWVFITDTQPRVRPGPGAFGDSEVLTVKGTVSQQAVAASLRVRGHMF